MPSSPPEVVAVCGAGTMGSGIAQLAACAGARTLLHDFDGEALGSGLARARKGIEKLAERGKLSPEEAKAASERLVPVRDYDPFDDAQLVIEAIPERLELKQQLFDRLSRDHVPASCVLATNTSSLPVTAVAAGAKDPSRVVGMHFFNPPPLMKLLEVVAGEESAPDALDLATACGEAMGRTVIRARDGIGFIVNRCNRPYGLEALRIVQERIATPEQVDRIYRQGAGFRMGPFELMDLVGLDVGFSVTKSFWEQSFSEPRWRPSPLVERLVQAGHHGRKSGRGFYTYPGDGSPHRPADPEPPPLGGGEGRLVVVSGDSEHALALSERIDAAGFRVSAPVEAVGELPWLIVDCGPGEEDPPLQGAPQAILLEAGSLAALDPEGASAGFYVALPLGSLAELARSPTTSDEAARRTEELFAALGMLVEWVADAPGLVSGRALCQLINEALFAVAEGVGSAEDVDTGIVLGMNHPIGPFARAEALGFEHVATVLSALWDEYREERYRLAPTLPRFG